MPFLCKIKGDDRVFHTVKHRDYLRCVWTGHQKSNLICIACGDRVNWVDPNKTIRPHVRHRESVSCSQNKIKNTKQNMEHAMIQQELCDLGQRMGQKVDIEHASSENGFRGDVVWWPSMICWEVDLTANSRFKQNIRKKARQKSNLRMISLAGAKKLKKVMGAAVVETIAIHNLEKPLDERYPLAKLFIENFHRLSYGESGTIQWEKYKGLHFEEHVRLIINDKIEYIDFKSNSGINPTGWGWCFPQMITQWNLYIDIKSSFKKKEIEFKAVERDLAIAKADERQLRNNLCDIVITKRHLHRITKTRNWQSFMTALYAFEAYQRKTKSNTGRESEVVKRLLDEIRKIQSNRLVYLLRTRLSRKYKKIVGQYPIDLSKSIKVSKSALEKAISGKMALAAEFDKIQNEKKNLKHELQCLIKTVALRK